MTADVQISDFKFSMPLQLRWNDLDPLNHVNNVYYFDYFQNARGYYMPTVCPQWDWTKHMFIIAHIECSYMKELKLTSQKPTIKVRTLNMGNKSFDLQYIITSINKEGEEIIHAVGKSTQVMFSTEERKTIEIPDWMRQNISNFEPSFNSNNN